MENLQNLSFNYHQIPNLIRLLMCTYLAVGIDKFCVIIAEADKRAPAFNIFSGTQTRYSGLGSSDWKVTLQKVNVAEHIHEQDKNVLVSQAIKLKHRNFYNYSIC